MAIGKIRNLGGTVSKKTEVAYFAGKGQVGKGNITLAKSLLNKYVFFILCWATPSNGNFYGLIVNNLIPDQSPKQVFTTYYYNTRAQNVITIVGNKEVLSEGNYDEGWTYGLNAVVVGTNKEEVIAKAKSLATISELATIYDYTT